VSRREQIRMGDAEVAAFLEEQRTVVCATNGRDGWPHLMPLWYIVRDDDDDGGGDGPAGPRLWSWTYAASQKARNLERDPRATLQVETGEQYQELRGVMFKADVVVHRDTEVVAATGIEIFTRYAGGIELGEELRAMVHKQAPKRVALEFVERERATWDHRKLGAVY
jgi:general stress protein 26